jgi:hypothetical protein
VWLKQLWAQLVSWWLLYTPFVANYCRKAIDFVRRMCRQQPPATYAERIAVARANNLLYLGETCTSGLFRTRYSPIYDRLINSLTLVGDPGSGKTTWILGLIRQLIEGAQRRTVVYMFDLKGSGPEVPRYMQYLARRHSWRFYYFSPEAEYSHGFNIVENLARASSGDAEYAEALALGIQAGTGMDHQYWFGRSKREIRALLRRAPRASTFRALANELANSDAGDLKDIEGLWDALEEWAGVESLNRSALAGRGADPRHRSIDCVRLAQQGRALVYVRLPRLRSLARTMMRCVKDSTVKVNSRLGTAQRTQVVMLVDEFHRIAGDDLVSEIQAMGRDVALMLVLAFQNFSQVARVSQPLVHEIMSMPSLYFGAADGGFSDRLFLDSSTQEFLWHEWATAEHPARPGYLSRSTLRSADLESLMETPGSFLARMPGAKCNPLLTYGSMSHCMPLALYESFRTAGFFERPGELPGAVLNPQYDFFAEDSPRRRRLKNTLPTQLAKALRQASQKG